MHEAVSRVLRWHQVDLGAMVCCATAAEGAQQRMTRALGDGEHVRILVVNHESLIKCGVRLDSQ